MRTVIHQCLANDDDSRTSHLIWLARLKGLRRFLIAVHFIYIEVLEFLKVALGVGDEVFYN